MWGGLACKKSGIATMRKPWLRHVQTRYTHCSTSLGTAPGSSPPPAEPSTFVAVAAVALGLPEAAAAAGARASASAMSACTTVGEGRCSETNAAARVDAPAPTKNGTRYPPISAKRDPSGAPKA